MEAYFYLLLYLMPFALLFPASIPTAADLTANTESTDAAQNVVIGAILDCSSRVGKEERVAMEIAVEDLNKKQNMNLILHVKCSPGEPLQAAQAARHLIIKNHAQAIVGPNSWEESSAAADVAHRHDVPILSLSSSAPSWATTHWPTSFVQASPDTSSQMKATAAIIQSWNWRRVNVIYEDRDSAPNDILNHLNQALEDSNVQTSRLLTLPSFVSSDTLRDELEKLRKENPCRVFLVHAGLEVAELVFLAAKKLRMMEKDYVWIATDQAMSLVHSINSSVILSMQGVVGVRRYLSETGHNFSEFYARFLEGFRKKYPEGNNNEPGVSAVQAYDAMWAVGLAMNNTAGGSKRIVGNFEEMDFDGLSGRIQFQGRKLAPVSQVQIINVGKSDPGLGFWSDGKGFSPVIDGTEGYSPSMEFLGHVFWPGGPWSTPRGWEIPTVSNPLRIGVPNVSLTNKFVRCEYDATKNGYIFSGFSIEVFNKTVQNLNYSLPYKFVAFNGNYPDLVKQVGKEFDAAVGDIAIISTRYNYVEFTHAHTESGLVMVVPIQAYSSKAWLFVKPFTMAMWLLTGFINIYNGFVVWSIERNYCSELRGPFLNQIVQLLWLAFARLLSMNGERLHSNLSKMTTLVWLFVCLILTQSYTASLSSMLTVQRIEPKFANIETLKSENKIIGCSKMSFVRSYLTDVLGYNPNYIKNFTSPKEYADAFRNGTIEAAFLEAPVAKLFIAKYCKSFIIAGPTYKVGGYGFAFQKGSPLLPDIDKALLKVFENGEAKDLEKNLIESEECMDIQVDNENGSLSPHSFFVLFVLSGSTSTAALAIYYFRAERKMEHSMAEHKGVWVLILMVLGKLTKHQRNRMSRKVSDLESPRASPNSSS